MKKSKAETVNQTSDLDRRTFLKWVGAGSMAGTFACRKGTDPEKTASLPWVDAKGGPNFTSPKYPLPLPGDAVEGVADRLATYQVVDDLVLPEGFSYKVIAQWGDRFGKVRFGTNCDFTGLQPIAGRTDEFYLFVNHEDFSARSWLQGFSEIHGRPCPDLKIMPPTETYPDPQGYMRFEGMDYPDRRIPLDAEALASWQPYQVGSMQDLCSTALNDMGICVLHVRRLKDGSFEVVRDSDLHFRITGLSRREPGADPVAVTGPAAAVIPENPPGTFGNCSGAVTPWGTFLTCEENIQNHLDDRVDPSGKPYADQKPELRMWHPKTGPDFSVPEPFIVGGLSFGLKEPLDGTQYGWVCEVDPASAKMKKHTNLGRFRHENVALRCKAGEPLVAYMGDDRRGGHVWKFVSSEKVVDPSDPANSKLLEKGNLYAADFQENYKGRWLLLDTDTVLRRPRPERGATGHIHLPARPEGGSVRVGTQESKYREIGVDIWVSHIESYTGKPFAETTLADLVVVPEGLTEEQAQNYRRGVILTDAFLMAGAAGATPLARAEDLEVHPYDQSVYIAFTDSTGGYDGSADLAVFPDSNSNSSRKYGAVFHLKEDRDDPGSETFSWSRLVVAGEIAEKGGGFACADNLVFDPSANLWMVTDVSTHSLNHEVDRSGTTVPGKPAFRGIFGNSAMFVIPVTGPDKGKPRVFALGPCECELTGPTFTEDGKTLIVSVQHPGEIHGVRLGRAQEERSFQILDAKGKPFTQKRSVPLGSNFPSKADNAMPKSAVVSIFRKEKKEGQI